MDCWAAFATWLALISSLVGYSGWGRRVIG